MSIPVRNGRFTAAGACLACTSARPRRFFVSVLLLAIAFAHAIIPSPARAQGDPGTTGTSGAGDYAVARWTIDGGGGRSSGGTYTLSGTIAQPDADPSQPSTGAGYAMTGGFWPGVEQAVPGTALFADGFESP